MKKGRIFEIKRFAVHDGDGIRTTVFFKGCSLKCVWCHNPEGIGFEPQLAYYANKCIQCGECVRVCTACAHDLSKEPEDFLSSGKEENDCGHMYNRKVCTACGNCEKVCLGEALKYYGKDITVDEILPVLLEDKDFYETSGGGITLSGGECLMQAEFCAELLQTLKARNIHTAVDTCGFVPRAAIDKVLPYTDVFLYDIKAYEEDVHIRCTGQSNQLILDNLRYIDACGKNIEVRIPYVPEYNGNQIKLIATLLSELKHLSGVRVLPYHNYAGSKYEALGMENTLPLVLPEEIELEQAKELLCEKGIRVI